MNKVYVNDSGHEMEATDFLAYLNMLIDKLISEGWSKEAATATILNDDFFGDSIIDNKWLEEVREFMKTHQHIEHKHTIHA